jgi:hypothetical protein
VKKKGEEKGDLQDIHVLNNECPFFGLPRNYRDYYESVTGEIRPAVRGAEQ